MYIPVYSYIFTILLTTVLVHSTLQYTNINILTLPTQLIIMPGACCRGPIRELRWHCDSCPGYDVCDMCYGAPTAPAHEHLLTPFRVTYI